MKRLIAVLTMIMMLFSMGMMQAFAEGEEATGDTAAQYTLNVYSGNKGNFGGKKVWSKTYKYGEYVDLTTEDLGFKLEDETYYVKGFRLTGHDNGIASSTGTQALRFNIDRDLDYELAYGIAGNMTTYTVRYVDQAGNDLIAADTFYGKIGDKPMVAFRYVEGYLPASYYITGTLKESNNVFTFAYNPAEGNVTVNTIINNILAPGAGAAGAAAGVAGAGAGAGAAAADGANIGDGGVPLADQPDQVVDIDNGDTPTADNPTDIDDNKTPGAGLNWPAIGGGIGAVALIAVIAALLAKRRKDSEEVDEEE